MKKILIVCILLGLSMSSLYAQNKMIKGRVIDDNLEPLPYVSILINDTIKVGKTDINGFFQIEMPFSVNKILFMDVGMEPASIDLIDKCDEVDVVMMLDGTYDFVTVQKVDRLRMKRFKKLRKLHKEAFEKGIFKTYNTCYTQEFIYAFKKNKRSIN